MKKMRILYVSPSYYPALKYGGATLAPHLLNKALVQKEVEIDVVTSNAGVEDRPDIPCRKWIEWDGVPVQYLPYWGYEHYNFSPSLFWETMRLVPRYDLIHINAVWNFPVLAGSIASIMHHKPYIISPQGTLYKETVEIKSRNKKTFYYHLLARHYLKRAACLHFTSENEQKETMRYLGLCAPSVVVPNGIDLTEFQSLPLEGSFRKKYAILQGKRYILFLGRIHPKKGLDLLVEAYKKVALQYSDLYLVIVGPDQDGYGSQIRSWLSQTDLLSRTLFTGMLTGSEKLAAFVDSECFVLPSYSENFGMVVIEAMACGVPVVISQQVGISEAIAREKSGIVVKNTKESLEQGMCALLEDVGLRKTVAENGKKFVYNHYDVSSVANQMMAVYERILGA